MPVEAILMDIDGTLMDSNGLHVIAWQRALRRVGQQTETNAIVHLIGMGSDKFAPTVLGEDAGDAIEQAQAFHGEEYIEKGLIDCAEPFIRAPELLAALSERGIRVSLASSAKQDELDRYLDKLGGEGCAEAIVTLADVSASKPEPDIFATAWEKLGKLENTIVIGDTTFDVEAAGKIGLPCVCVLSGGIERWLLEEAGAVAIYQDAEDLLANLDTLLAMDAARRP